MTQATEEFRFAPLEHVRIPDRAVHQVQELILSGQLKPGDRLPPERDLVRQLGVGRTSVREALRILEGMGLLTVKPGVGIFVAQSGLPELTVIWKNWLYRHKDRLFELLEVREALELRAVLLATQMITDEEIRLLEAVIDRMGQCVENRDVKGIVECDREFHDRLARASRNELLVRMNASLYDALDEARLSIFTVLPEVRKTLVDEHRAIVNAIQARDAAAAQAKMVYHMNRLRADIRKALEMKFSYGAEAGG